LSQKKDFIGRVLANARAVAPEIVRRWIGIKPANASAIACGRAFPALNAEAT